MKESLRRETLQQLAIRYKESLEWLGKFLNVETTSRLTSYHHLLGLIQGIEPSAAIATVLEYPPARSAFFEAHRIIEACLSIKAVDDRIGIPKETLTRLQLNEFLSYSEAREESSSDSSRDTFFELFIAARFLQKGHEVSFSKYDADIVVLIEDYKVFVECKRVQAKRKFYRNIKKGLDQLETRYTKGRVKEIGLVFLSIDNLVNPNFDLIKVDSMDAMIHDSVSKVERYSLPAPQESVNRYGWPNKKSVGLVIEAAIPYVLGDRTMPGMRQITRYSTYFHLPTGRMDHFEFFERMKTSWA